MKKETIKSIREEFQKWRIAAKDYMFGLRIPARRELARVAVTDTQGHINGMSVPELLTFVNLSALTGERVFLQAEGKVLIFKAEKNAPPIPPELQ